MKTIDSRTYEGASIWQEYGVLYHKPRVMKAKWNTKKSRRSKKAKWGFKRQVWCSRILFGSAQNIYHGLGFKIQPYWPHSRLQDVQKLAFWNYYEFRVNFQVLFYLGYFYVM